MACVRKLGDKRYRIDYRDARGNRLRKTFETLREANTELTKIRKRLDEGTFVSPKDVPTFAAVAKRWLDGKKAGNYRPSTLEGWRIHLDNHLLDDGDKETGRRGHGIGHMKLNKINAAVMEAFRNERHHSGIAPQTVNKILTTAAAIFDFAIRHQETSTNPAKVAERLKVGAGELAQGAEEQRTGTEVREDEVFSPAELRALIENAEEGLYRTLFTTAALTGARHDELLGLMWADVDLEAGRVTIRRSLSWAKVEKDAPTKARFFPPKTKAGRRTIDIPPPLAMTLKVWKLQCPIGDDDLVFPNTEGKPQHRSNVLRAGLYPALEAAEITRRMDMHSFRHTFASMLIARGEPPTRVANLLGHSNAGVTMKVYAHWFKDVKTEAVNELARELLSDRSV